MITKELYKLFDSLDEDHSKRLIFGKRQTTIGCAVLYFVCKNERLNSINRLSGYFYNELINYGRS